MWCIISLPILTHMEHSNHPIYFSNICCLIWGIYHPIYFQWGTHPSHCWLLWLYIKTSHSYGHKISHRAPFHPASSWGILPSHLIFFLTHGAPVLPIVSCSSNIPLFGTHGHLDFCLTAQNILSLYLDLSFKSQFFFYLVSPILFYLGIYSMLFIMGYLPIQLAY